MARSLWSGSIAFGLVNIPIQLFTAVKDKSIGFHMMSKDGNCRLRRKLYCPETGKEYDFKDTARGFEISPDQYVILDEKEIKALRPEKGDVLKIEQFIDAVEIDPIYFNNAYIVGPGKGGDRAYSLMRDILEESNKIALGTFVMRNHEYLAILRQFEGAICLQTLHYANEIVDVRDILKLKELPKIPAKEKKIAVQLVENMTEIFKPSAYKSRYQEELRELIERKFDGKSIHRSKADPKPIKVIDLMEALEKSVKARSRTKYKKVSKSA